MLLISHRGNTSGRNPDLENTQKYMQLALDKGYIVECDMVGGKCWGHDKEGEYINWVFVLANKQKLLIHCKDLKSLNQCALLNLNCFYHSEDDFAVSSEKWIISHSRLGVQDNCICMLPEIHGLSKDSLKNCVGICSDIIDSYA